MSRIRKKLKSKSKSDTDDLNYKLNHKCFDLIKNVTIDRDSLILDEFGVPNPPESLSLKTNTKLDQFNIIINVFSKYSEYLLDAIERCEDPKFIKRKIMFLKLVRAMNLKFICAFRWKYYDRLLFKSIDRNKFGFTNNIQKVKEYLQIYQSLWQDHCHSMQKLLGEWNDVNYLMKTYKLENGQEVDISTSINKLNQYIEKCITTSNTTTNTNSSSTTTITTTTTTTSSNEDELETMLNKVKCDKDFITSVDNFRDKINDLKYTKTNHLQSIVNRTIGKYEQLLSNINNYNDTLIKVSNNISEKMFKKMPIKDYVKLIQYW